MPGIGSFAGAGGAGGAGTGAGQVGQTQFTSIDPAAQPGGGSFGSTLQNLMSRLPGAPPSYQDLISQGVNSPLLQSVLGPALQNLIPGEEMGRENLASEFRSAGALGSGAQGVASSRLENAFQGQRGNLISQIISSMLPTMTQGLANQYNQQLAVPGLLGSILGSTRPATVTGNVPPMQFLGFGSGGAGGGGGAGAGGAGDSSQSWADFQARLAGFNSAADQAAAEKGGGGGATGVNYTQDPFAGLDLSGIGGYAGLGPQTPQPQDPASLVYGTPQAITQGPSSMPYDGAIDYTQDDPFQAASLAESF